MELARHTDPSTSHNAAKDIDLTALQSDVLDAFLLHGSLTDKQLNTMFAPSNYAESTVRKRRSELTALGYLKDSGDRDGRHAVWELV
jgi:hypothetical protein